MECKDLKGRTAASGDRPEPTLENMWLLEELDALGDLEAALSSALESRRLHLKNMERINKWLDDEELAWLAEKERLSEELARSPHGISSDPGAK